MMCNTPYWPFFDSLFLALFLSVCLSYPSLFSFHFHLDLTGTSSSMWSSPRQLYTGIPLTEESCPFAENTTFTKWAPKWPMKLSTWKTVTKVVPPARSLVLQGVVVVGVRLRPGWLPQAFVASRVEIKGWGQLEERSQHRYHSAGRQTTRVHD